MDPRQKQLLKLLIDHHIKSADPVGSNSLVKDYSLEWSPATIRAELVALEESGYLSHPHTSAGRIPTEKGYRLYVDELMEDGGALSHSELQALLIAWKQAADYEIRLKAVMKAASEMSSALAVFASSAGDIYFSGMKRLFDQPEFLENSLIPRVTGMMDAMEEKMATSFESVDEDVDVFIGSDNPLDEHFGSIVARVSKGGLFMLLGPMRMDYGRGVNLAEKIKEMFNEF